MYQKIRKFRGIVEAGEASHAMVKGPWSACIHLVGLTSSDSPVSSCRILPPAGMPSIPVPAEARNLTALIVKSFNIHCTTMPSFCAISQCCHRYSNCYKTHCPRHRERNTGHALAGILSSVCCRQPVYMCAGF